MTSRGRPRRRWAFLLLAMTAFLLATLAAAGTAQAQRPLVLQIDIEGAITRATVIHFEEVLAAAEVQGADAILLRLDTPGGGLAETEEIVKAMLRTPLPFLGYVHPVGARALSAGTMILMATDVAAMSPGTTIGSLQPVLITPGGFEPVTDDKIINALVAEVEESLRAHDRNVTLAEAFIKENLNLNAEQALQAGATEFVASSVRELLQAVTGTSPFKGISLALGDAMVEVQAPSLRLRAIVIISDPLIASILFLLGIYGVIFGISSPGHGAEIFGVIAISLGLVGLGFSVSLIALFLIVLGVILLLVEIATPSFGVIGGGGIIAIVLGTLFLAPVRPPEVLLAPEAQTEILVALLVPTAVVGGFLLFALYKVLEARRAKPHFVMEGERAEAVDRLQPGERGFVRYEGELWRAVTDEAVEPDQKVYVLGKEGPYLRVSRTPPPTPPEEGAPRLHPLIRWLLQRLRRE